MALLKLNLNDPLMIAIKAVNSIGGKSLTEEDLKRQRSAMERAGKLAAPTSDVTVDEFKVKNIACEWVRPDFAHNPQYVILYAHGGGYTCGGLGYARILAAKLEILDGAKQGAPLVLNMDDEFLANAVVHGLRKVWYYSVKEKNCDVYAMNIINRNAGVDFDICYGGEIAHARINCIGVHNVKNALAAFCVGLILQVPVENILEGIESFRPEGLRQNITVKNGVNFVVDCYNAAPDSMRSSISVLDQLETDGMRYCVLADMLELGERSEEFHKTVGKYVADSHADRLYCFGELARNYILGAVENGFDKSRCMHFSDKDELADYLRSKLQKGDSVLLKGSRGMALEKVFEAI